jgi:predicted DNA-binding transcriptional regulator YafY
MTKKNTPLTFKYKNWQGETAIRHIIPIKFWYGRTEFHKKDQWLLKATDVDKNAERDFAVKDILEFLG